MRDNDRDSTSGLYMNDNLTTFNFNLFMKLKREKQRRTENQLENFEALYTIDGRIYLKISRQATNDEAIAIRNNADVEKFLSKMNNNS